ncbi:ABC transporter permease, partial [Devosia psychrophila]|uniref:ABC transporter permease n=1 Tax=Devosia psychrophila TaxID=728005 RepID=UPI003D0976C1
MGMMVGLSFHPEGASTATLANYERFFTDDFTLAGLGRTVLMSGLVAICVTVMAYPVAYFLARSRSRWRAVVFALAIAPELAGVVLRTYGWLNILEDQGFINSGLMWLGLISEPLPLAKNMFGVVVGLTHVILPFGILSLLTSLQGVDPSLEKSAQILGASRISVLRHIVVPLTVPGIVSSMLLAFTMSASAYATPATRSAAGPMPQPRTDAPAAVAMSIRSWRRGMVMVVPWLLSAMMTIWLARARRFGAYPHPLCIQG